jgi:hypothetical protein
MVRGEPVVGGASHDPLVVAGWLCAVLLPLVGLVVGVVAVRKPDPVRTQGVLIVIVSLSVSLAWGMWALTLAGAGSLFFTS